jgi:type II secretory pathway pseudopilin PulG
MSERGYTFLELLFVLSAFATLSGIAVPQLLSGLDAYRTSGAARYLAARIQRARIEAIARSTNVAMQFVQSGSGYSFAVYVDGNGDGVRTADVREGIDPCLVGTERLTDHFPGVEFGLLPDLPPIDPGSPPPGTDPIKLGTSSILSYSPTGTSSSGSLYVRGRSNAQYAVRVLGDTGRTRVLRYDARARQWRPV